MNEILTSGLVDVGKNLLSQGVAYFRDRAARQWQEDMWNKQNEYNLPINQRKRLEEAGINPNLAFGSAASAMGTSVPSSPTTHVPSVDLGEFWLRYKQAKSQIAAQEAETRRTDQVTRQLDLNNQILESLFNDKIETERGDLYVRRLEQAWNEDHLKQMKDAGLTEKELRNDILQLQTAWHSKQNEKLQREIEHLNSKYGFEDFFYEDRINPYPGNAYQAGITLGGMFYSVLERLLDYLSRF